ncbi:MAG TPA: hypothetical protein PLZ38_12215 [Spirochaetota bacterium]|nr:hypothetical protein [Spirochaetota bacterium]HOR94730.1 hypothetical protein [Spirochaetota bacterium]
MIKVIFRMVYTLALITLISCGAEDSSGSSSAEFKIQPGDVQKFSTTIEGKTSFDVKFNSTPISGDFAIIVSNVNSTGNVGITFGTDPKTNRRFKVYIYYEGDRTNGTKSGSATVIENGIKYSGTFSNVDFLYSGPDANNCYTISIIGNITVESKTESKTLQFNSDLIAYLVQ